LGADQHDGGDGHCSTPSWWTVSRCARIGRAIRTAGLGSHGPDGTLGNRFDDPGGLFDIPGEDRFRVIYCATQREAAFAEVLSRFRQRPHLAQLLSEIEDDEETVAEALDGALDPEFPDHGLLESDWLQRRRVGHTQVVPLGDFVDVSTRTALHT
jgi:hypothetical protein